MYSVIFHFESAEMFETFWYNILSQRHETV